MKNCIKCNKRKICRYLKIMLQNQEKNITVEIAYCQLAHEFVDQSSLCLKDKPMEEVVKLCHWYIPPERMNDGKSCCTARLADGRACECWTRTLQDLLNDPDFKIDLNKIDDQTFNRSLEIVSV